MSSVVSNEIFSKVSSKFNFTVDKFPLAGPDGMRTPWYGLFRNDNGEVVGDGSVSSRYVPHQTDDVLALVEATSSAFEGITNVDCYFRNGHYVTIQPTREERVAILQNGTDNVFPRVIIRAGYDGKAFNATMGYYRDLCRNMARISAVRTTSVSIRHTSGLREKMNELIDTFSVLKESWADLTQVITAMESRRVSMTEFLDTVYGNPDVDSKRAVTQHKNRTEAIFRRLTSEQIRSGRQTISSNDGFMVSVWEAFNAVQGYVQHDATRKGGSDPLNRAIQAMNDQAVSRAESYALQLVA